MEDSLSKATAEEESGWTAYFEDFLAQQIDVNKSNTCTYISDHNFSSPSLVSDAASNVPWKKNNNFPTDVCPRVDDQLTFLTKHKKLNFKKTRAKGISHHDDSLEDTASSPINSPKVSSLKHGELNHGKRVDKNDFSTSRSQDFYASSGMELDKKDEMSSDGNCENEYSELKKKGLCLVPLSMLVNYIG